MEPDQLRRGKEFHRLVQTDWAGTVAGRTAHPEHGIQLSALTGKGARTRRGRIDIFIDKINDFVTVVEIKATEPPRDCRRLQLLRGWSYDKENIDKVFT